LKKIVRIQKRTPRHDLEKLYAQRQKVPDTLDEKLGVIKCEVRNVDVWGNKKNVCYGTMSDLVVKVERRAKKPWITQEMINKINKGSGRMSIMKEEGTTTEA
jgi:hypothetical protein